MPYEIKLTPSAAKLLRVLPVMIQVRCQQAIDGLALDPRPPGVKKLQGVEGLYRIRVGDFRIIYEIRDKVLVVVVVRIASRQGAYKRR